MVGAFRLGKHTVLYTPLCDPSMAPIHSDRGRRHSLRTHPHESDGPSLAKSGGGGVGGGQRWLLCTAEGEQ